jgi:MYXO-CTERM domain-containing protein
LLFGGTLGVATAANAATTTILDLTTAGAVGNVTKNATVGSQSNVTTLGGPFGITWGSATGGTRPGSTQTSGFGMQASGDAGVGGWAGTQGALLSDITGASFDWYNSNSAQGLGGGFRLYMDVYSPTVQGNNEGYLQFDLSFLLPTQVGGQWNSTGNYLAGAAGSAWYSPISGSNPIPPLSNGDRNYQTWAQIQTTLAGWSVMQIGIINDSGMTVSVDNFTVTSVPAPGAVALLGLAGAFGGRRRRA